MIVLREGSYGQDVVKLQLILNGFLNPEIKLKNDGHFGKLTEDAVKIFQKKKGLSIDGIVGLNTWNALVGSGAISTNKIDLSPSTGGAPWYDIAVAEIGVKELAGPAMNNKRILEYHKTTSLNVKNDEVPWCSSFVNWVMIQAGIEGTNNALAKSWVTWGQATKVPSKGDVIVIKKKNETSDAATGSYSGYHVGFFVEANIAAIVILGGNQRDQVKESAFPRQKYEVVAYRRPFTRFIGVPLSNHLRYSAFA